MKLCSIVGARPQFIKSAPVSRALADANGPEEVMVHTGQHFDHNMSNIFFDELGIPAPHHNLGIHGLSHGAMTGRMLEALENTFTLEKPDWVLVYGDTNSTLAAALAAAKLHIPVAHVEAGLRSFNRAMPEEVNRVLTDHCSELLFTPTDTATRNLQAEGIASETVLQVGDVMQDAVHLFGRLAAARGHGPERHGMRQGAYVLVTVHRQENTDDPARLGRIMEELGAVAAEMPVLWPIHPRTRARIEAFGLRPAAGVVLSEPLGYLEMLAIERTAAVIVTDSGGVQKEAYFHRVPCVTLRDETEWTELVVTGWNRLCPPVEGAPIAAAVLEAIGTRGREAPLYGDGAASKRIASVMSRRC